MPPDSLEQHRRELDALFAFCRGARDAFELVVDRDARIEAQLSELRSDFHALSNRVEALTRGLADDGHPHSIGIGAVLTDDPLVVINMEADIPEVVGVYAGAQEDGLRYYKAGGGIGIATYDVVQVARRSELPAIRQKAARS